MLGFGHPNQYTGLQSGLDMSLEFVEKFVDHIEDIVKRYCATFSQQPMTDHADVFKKEHETAEKCHIGFKEFISRS